MKQHLSKCIMKKRCGKTAKRMLVLPCICLVFLMMAGLCLPCAAQEMLPTTTRNGLWGLDAVAIKQMEPFAVAAVTYLPEGCVLYLDGKPLALFTPVSPGELRRARLFCTAKNPLVGVTVMGESATIRTQLRIRCINPVFEGKIGLNPQIKEV